MNIKNRIYDLISRFHTTEYATYSEYKEQERLNNYANSFERY